LRLNARHRRIFNGLGWMNLGDLCLIVKGKDTARSILSKTAGLYPYCEVNRIADKLFSYPAANCGFFWNQAPQGLKIFKTRGDKNGDMVIIAALAPIFDLSPNATTIPAGHNENVPAKACCTPSGK
jgi:hypothetical protein